MSASTSGPTGLIGGSGSSLDLVGCLLVYFTFLPKSSVSELGSTLRFCSCLLVMRRCPVLIQSYQLEKKERSAEKI